MRLKYEPSSGGQDAPGDTVRTSGSLCGVRDPRRDLPLEMPGVQHRRRVSLRHQSLPHLM